MKKKVGPYHVYVLMLVLIAGVAAGGTTVLLTVEQTQEVVEVEPVAVTFDNDPDTNTATLNVPFETNATAVGLIPSILYHLHVQVTCPAGGNATLSGDIAASPVCGQGAENSLDLFTDGLGQVTWSFSITYTGAPGTYAWTWELTQTA